MVCTIVIVYTYFPGCYIALLVEAGAVNKGSGVDTLDEIQIYVLFDFLHNLVLYACLI